MKYLLNVIVILCWAAPAWAAPALVRSGEHGSFTRIVVDADPSSGWQIEQDGREVTLDLPRNGEGFAIAGVFQRITRERLADIAADQRRLTLTLGCDCVVTPSSMEPNYIILDIAPGTPPEGVTDGAQATALDWTDSIAAMEAAFGLQGPAAPAEPAAATRPAAPALPPEPVVLPLVQAPAARSPFALNRTIAGGMATQANPEAEALDLQTTGEALTVLEDRLARQIGLAATQGLLKPAPNRRQHAPVATAEETPEAPETDQPADTLEALLDQGDRPRNLRIESSVETREKPEGSVATTMDGLTCAEPELFAVQDWGTEGGFGAEIAGLRNMLYGEFDKLDRAAQIALARAYIYYGFGAEALQIAELDPRGEKTDAAITVIARLIEYGPGPQTDGLVRFAECDSDAALWAILADDGSGRPERMNTAAALRALGKLPYHLRSFIAPELSKRLRKHGDGDSAARAMRSVSRTPHVQESPAMLEQAEIDLAGGRNEKASEGFEEVIAENSFEAPRALIRFIDLQVASGEAISKDTALLAEAYAAEYRGSELAPEITRAHVTALAKSGQFNTAFEVLESARGLGMVSDQLLGGVFAILQAEADDVTFLRRAMALTESDLSQLSPRVQLDLAGRLLQLGFADQAEVMLAKVKRDVAPRDQQLLRGRIHLALGNHRQALAAAGTFDGDEFEALRADTFFATGRYEEAAAIYDRIGMPDRAEAAAWKAPAGSVPALPGDDSLTRATDIADRAVPAAEGGLLARADALLSDSSTLGADIEELLANPDLNIGTGG